MSPLLQLNQASSPHQKLYNQNMLDDEQQNHNGLPSSSQLVRGKFPRDLRLIRLTRLEKYRLKNPQCRKKARVSDNPPNDRRVTEAHSDIENSPSQVAHTCQVRRRQLRQLRIKPPVHRARRLERLPPRGGALAVRLA